MVLVSIFSTVVRFRKSFTQSEASLLLTSGQFVKWGFVTFSSSLWSDDWSEDSILDKPKLSLKLRCNTNKLRSTFCSSPRTDPYPPFNPHSPFQNPNFRCLNLKGEIGEYAFCFVQAFCQKYARIILQSDLRRFGRFHREKSSANSKGYTITVTQRQLWAHKGTNHWENHGFRI